MFYLWYYHWYRWAWFFKYSFLHLIYLFIHLCICFQDTLTEEEGRDKSMRDVPSPGSRSKHMQEPMLDRPKRGAKNPICIFHMSDSRMPAEIWLGSEEGLHPTLTTWDAGGPGSSMTGYTAVAICHFCELHIITELKSVEKFFPICAA